MAERKTQVLEPGTNKMVDGFEVPVEESTERWSEFKLEDGTVIKVKMTMISAIRLDGKYDQEGDPIYSFKMTPISALASAPERLRKKAQ